MPRSDPRRAEREGPHGDPDTPSYIPLRDLPGWIALAWVAWWSFAYVQSALAHRFPQVLGWLARDAVTERVNRRVRTS